MASQKRYGRDRHRPPGEWVQATLVEKVVGVQFRKSNVREFCECVARGEKSHMAYGVALAPEPDNEHDPFAIAVLGQCMVKKIFRKPKLVEWHVGYVSKDLARELHKDFLSKDIPIASELYKIYTAHDYYDIEFLVLAPPGHSHSSRMRRKA